MSESRVRVTGPSRSRSRTAAPGPGRPPPARGLGAPSQAHRGPASPAHATVRVATHFKSPSLSHWHFNLKARVRLAVRRAAGESRSWHSAGSKSVPPAGPRTRTGAQADDRDRSLRTGYFCQVFRVQPEAAGPGRVDFTCNLKLHWHGGGRLGRIELDLRGLPVTRRADSESDSDLPVPTRSQYRRPRRPRCWTRTRP